MVETFEVELATRFERWGRLGRRSYSDGSEEYGRIPHAGSHAFLHCTMPAPSSAAIEQAETALGQTIPEGLRRLWIATNGLRLFHLSLDIRGLPTQFSRALEAPPQPFDFVQYNSYSRPIHLDPRFIVCGGYGFDASKVLLKEDGAVCVSGRDGASVTEVGGSLTEFVLAEYDRLAELFDARGRLICGEDMTTHPALRRRH